MEGPLPGHQNPSGLRANASNAERASPGLPDTTARPSVGLLLSPEWCTVLVASLPSERGELPVATDYDDLRPDLKESQDESLVEAVEYVGPPDPRRVVKDLDGDDAGERGYLLG